VFFSRKGALPLALAALLAGALAGCGENIEGGGSCPILCPDQQVAVHDTTFEAVVLDTSLTSLNAARKELARFGDRVEYVQADLATSDWTGAVGGPFDVVVSSRTVHHIADPERVRALYREIHGLTGHGSTFLNLDYVRPAKAELARLGEWVTRDPDAGFAGAPHDVNNMAGNLQDHLAWLGEAGFGTVEVYMKQMDLVLLGAINGHLHMPWGHGDDPAKAGTREHGHGHGHGEGHAHG